MTRRPWVAAAVLTLLLSGCGGTTAALTAADRVPALGDRLDRIDRAIVAHRYGDARAALRALIRDTIAAERAGDLSHEAAARILAAARALLAGLPRPEQAAPSSEPTAPDEPTEKSERPSPTPTDPTITPSPAPTPADPSDPPTADPSGDPSNGQSPVAEPTAEPSREATPLDQASPAAQ